MRYVVLLMACCSLAAGEAPRPVERKPPAVADPLSTAKLLDTGDCVQAMPRVKKAYAQAADPESKKRLGVGGVRCAMSLNRVTDAASLIETLNRDFPRDADILYLTVHTYSDLSLRASQALLFTHPDAYQVHQLNAEALEAQGKWDEAAEEYRVVLAKNPGLPGIHYRLGRILLSKPETPTARDEARKEFEEELRIDPHNAGAEFVLAELARQAGNNEEAINRFTRASKNDVMFVDAYLGLGRSLLAAGKAPDAIAPLEKAARLQPENPIVHFQLATAYLRSGRKADADREFAAHKSVSEKARETTDHLKKAVSGTGDSTR